MLPMLLYLLCKKIRRQRKETATFKTDLSLIKSAIKTFICILAMLLLGSIILSVKGQKLNYKVTRNGDVMGWMRLEKKCTENHCSLTLYSGIKFRMIFSFTATVVECANFLNGKLIFSSLYHKTNGNVKVNKQTRFTGNYYEVSEDDEKEKLSFPDISFNLLSLYFEEPVAIKKVYCDKQERFADIRKTKDGGYKVNFPNGDSNCYYYSHGICTRVEIDHSFYSASVILNP